MYLNVIQKWLLRIYYFNCFRFIFIKCVYHTCGGGCTSRSQKGLSDALELELQVVLRCSELWPSEREGNAPN